ncbi:MAG: 2-iminoacetate synthase ThiH [Candidatus Saganbacteria bacterium]|nr:2-iminoacetate synthase ThiH [Candidatus Saganbacteria bacterium]
MSFLEVLQDTNVDSVLMKIKSADLASVRSVLSKEKTSFDDYLTLLSPAAFSIVEELAVKAQTLTLKNFGRAILLYAPIYVCNECDNQCVYCGFNQRVSGQRVCLSPDEVMREAEVLYEKGFRHILLVSGEKKDKVSLDYLKDVIGRLHDKFDSISLEIAPMEKNEYRELFAAGADGLTVYQEVYNRDIYKDVHPHGKKADYEFRLGTPERAGEAGFYRINIGALLGLGKWEEEAALLGLHAAYLKKKFWQSQIAVSFPRLRDSSASFVPPHPVSDKQLVQMICALRIFIPTLGLTISTRESSEFRDNLIPLGITQMSAESKTSPGGYSNAEKNGEQFEVADTRIVSEICAMLKKKGYDPVFKDWDRTYIPVGGAFA